MAENVQIKVEQKGKTLGGVAKPKFVPKAQPKRSIEELAAAKAAHISEQAANDSTGQEQSNSRFDYRGGRGDLRGRGSHSGRGRENAAGRGRGRWAMPSGISFFTGNNSGGKPGIAFQAPQRVGSYGMNTNPSHSTDSKSEVVKSEPSRSDSVQPQLPPDSDTDDEDNCQDVSETGKEIWPPMAFSAKEPFSLPFCPRTAEKRNEVANMPILAHPEDKRALEIEEQLGAFVFQFPSDLRLPEVGKGSVTAGKEAAPEKNEDASFIENRTVRGLHHLKQPTLKPGNIGKLQYMRSGKLFLIASNGKKYEVSAGIDVAFAQYLASISLDNDAPTAAPVATASHTSNPSGKFCMLSDVTRKVILTPTHTIGCRREVVGVDEVSGSASEFSSMPHSGVKDAGHGQQQPMPQYNNHSDASVGFMPNSMSYKIESQTNTAPAQAVTNSGTSTGSSSSQPHAKPSVRIRVAQDTKRQSAPTVRFTVNTANSIPRSNTTAPGSQSKAVSSTLAESQYDGISAEDFDQNEFVNDDGGEDEMDMDIE